MGFANGLDEGWERMKRVQDDFDNFTVSIYMNGGCPLLKGKTPEEDVSGLELK